MLLVLALVPLPTILSGANVLSVLAEVVSRRPLTSLPRFSRDTFRKRDMFDRRQADGCAFG